MNRLILGRVVIVAVIFFLVVPSISPARDTLGQDEADILKEYKVTYRVTFSPDDFIFDNVKGYDTVHLNEGACINVVGKPMMPAKEIRIALPAGMAARQVRVIDDQQVGLKGTYTVFPAQPPRKTDGSEAPAFVEPDRETYASMSAYPGKTVQMVQQTDLAGQSMAVVHLFPLQYTPREKKLTLYTSLTFVIYGLGGYRCGDYLPDDISKEGKETYRRMITDIVVNPKDVQLHTAPDTIPRTLSLPPGGPYDHVIITPSSYTSYWDDLVEWYTKRGLRTGVVTTNWINSNCAGSTLRHRVQDFIGDAHSSWGTMYFLLGGEHSTNPSSGIPFEYRTFSGVGESTPSDQCYSDYDNDWTHEVFVGRASIQSSTQATTFINKVLNYEKNPPLSDYVLDVLLIGMDTDASTELQYMKDDIDDDFIPTRFDVTKVYDSHGGNHETAAKNALNAGQNLVNHADHANYWVIGTGDYWHGWGIEDYEVDALYNDNKPSIVVSLGCWPNAMDYSDCIAEHFVIYNPNQAGIAFTGNTRSGLYYQDNDEYPYYLSTKLDYWWWGALFNYDKHILGQTMVQSKHLFGTDPWNPDAGRHCVWTFNLLGEPAMPIWTDTPEPLTVTHDATITTGSQPFDVHVSSSGDVQGATVCLWKGEEVYDVETTNSGGWAYFTIDPSTEGTMYVTVTKHNYLPYEGSTDVTEAGFTIEGDVFEPDGVTPLPDPTVTITNLETTEEWPATVEPGSNHYSLELTGDDIPSVNDELRIMAKKELDEGDYDPDGYTSSLNITYHTVTQTDIDNNGFTEDLNLDHYCINYYPDYPYHTKEEWNYSGAAVMQMWTDFKEVGPYTQDQLQLWGQSNNTDEDKGAGLQHIDPRGMAKTLKWLVGDTLPPGYTFVVGVMPNTPDGLSWAMHRVCWWQYTGPGALPTGGTYENWMSVRGIHTDKRPQNGTYAGEGDDEAWGYTVHGFWINDPDYPGGIGENSYKTADEWTSTYYTIISDPYNAAWDGKYITVLEPPERDAEVTISSSPSRLTTAIEPSMAATPMTFGPLTALTQTINDNEALDVVQAAIEGVTEELLPYDPDFSTTFKRTIAGQPLYVKDSKRTGDYYIVPFNVPARKDNPFPANSVMFERITKETIERVGRIDNKLLREASSIATPIPETRTLITVLVDAKDGHFKEASWVPRPAAYLPVSQEEALRIVYNNVKNDIDIKDVRTITIRLVHRDTNPYYPEWKITIDNYYVFYVNQDGMLRP